MELDGKKMSENVEKIHIAVHVFLLKAILLTNKYNLPLK